MTVEIGLSLDSAKYVRGSNKAKAAIGELDGAQKKASDSVTGVGAKSGVATGKLGGLAGKATAAAVALGPLGLVAAGTAAVVAIAAVTTAVLATASSVEDSQDKFDTLFAESSGSVSAFAEDWAGLVGVSTRVSEDLLANAAAIAQGMGFATDESAAFAQELVTVAGDLASFNDVSNERASEALTTALTGEREALKSLGIVITEADVSQAAMAMSGKDNAAAITAQEKAAATMELVMIRAGAAIGDSERTSDSLTTSLNKQDAAWANLTDELSIALAPALAETATVSQDVVEGLTFFFEIINLIPDAAKRSAEELAKLNDDFDRFVTLSTDEQTGAAAAGILDSASAAYNRLGEEIQDLIEEQKSLSDHNSIYAAITKASIEDQIKAREDEMAALLAQQEVLSDFEQDLKAVEEAEAARQAASVAAAAQHKAAAEAAAAQQVVFNAALADLTFHAREYADGPGADLLQTMLDSGLEAKEAAKQFNAFELLMRETLPVSIAASTEAVFDLGAELLEVPTVVFPEVEAEAKTFGDALVGIFTSASSGIGGIFDKLFSFDPGGILGAAQNLIPGIGGILGSLAGDFAETLGFGGEAATSVGAGLQQMAELAASVLPPPAGTIAGAVASLVPVFENVVGAIGSIFKSGTDGWVEAAEAAGIAMTQTFADAAHAMGQSMDEALENARILQEHFQGLAGQEYQLGLAQGFTGSRDEVINQYRKWKAQQRPIGADQGETERGFGDPTMPGGDPSMPGGDPTLPGGGPSAPPSAPPAMPPAPSTREANVIGQMAAASTAVNRAAGGSGF